MLKKIIIGIVVVSGVIGISWLIYSNIAENNFRVLVPQNEALTEMYLADYDKLPKNVITDKQYSFIFYIHNRENKKMTYPLKITLEASGEAKVIARDTIIVENNQLQRVKKMFSVSEPRRTKVVITLVNKKQSIHFWVDPVQ